MSVLAIASLDLSYNSEDNMDIFDASIYRRTFLIARRENLTLFLQEFNLSRSRKARASLNHFFDFFVAFFADDFDVFFFTIEVF